MELTEWIKIETAKQCVKIAQSVQEEFKTDGFKNSDWKKGSGAAHVAHRIREYYSLPRDKDECND